MKRDKKPSLLEQVQERVLVCDGAMGTILYSKGFYINRCFDELNLSHSGTVKEIHREYLKAGAEILETNTFGANRIKLEGHAYGKDLLEINRSGVKLAQEAIQETGSDGVWIAGSIGPLGIRIEPWGAFSLEEAREVFREQAEALADAGVDCLILETFSDLNEMHQAILGARVAADLPIIAQMTLEDDGNSLFGTSPEVFTARLDEWGADIIGVNCSVGPQVMLSALECMAKATSKKLSAQPNAGVPRSVEGRNIYLCSPEYMAKYAKRFIHAGAKIVGGCCGTTPEHIRAIRKAVQSVSPAARKVVAVAVVEKKPAVPPVPVGQKSQLARKISRGEFIVTVELTPPRGCDTQKAIENASFLQERGIDAINVPDGPRASARLSAQYLAIILQQEAGIETILHYCCRDRNLLGMQSDLLGAYAIGVKNILAITGDPPKLGDYPDATAVFDVDSIGLTNILTNLNKGFDVGGNSIGKPTAFYIGVGANPTALNLDLELKRLQYKVEAGAEFAITQPVFDVEKLLQFLERIEPFRIPVIAGLWPLVSYRNAEFMNNEVPGVTVPSEIMERMRKAGSGEKAQQEGITIAREALRRIRPYVVGVQISAPFGRVDSVMEVLKD
ncbi:MAG TPA: bifunctional homocysteine S-methyltransferase/methylenetetrahydrofolate reductase [Acidobacteriota bacterium]|jgi:homocysteine S-methyltransferase|nr:bifunctional homocysteine S-methyltransferase/methylenetetrahydrofolate reductase [Acidobacteriota bacterium]